MNKSHLTMLETYCPQGFWFFNQHKTVIESIQQLIPSIAFLGSFSTNNKYIKLSASAMFSPPSTVVTNSLQKLFIIWLHLQMSRKAILAIFAFELQEFVVFFQTILTKCQVLLCDLHYSQANLQLLFLHHFLRILINTWIYRRLPCPLSTIHCSLEGMQKWLPLTCPSKHDLKPRIKSSMPHDRCRVINRNGTLWFWKHH